jgi:hypothetical protein
VKRASPLILDNLGLTIRVGEANERYAKQLGKTVEQLTTEEQKMALLNDTLRAGAVMIDQAGGDTDSLTDSFERLDTATTNLSNELKEKLAPGLAAAAEATVLLLTWQQQIDAAEQEHMETIRKTAGSYDELIEQTRAMLAVSDKEKASIIDNIEARNGLAVAIEQMVKGGLVAEEAQWKYQRALEATFEPLSAIPPEMMALTSSFYEGETAAIAASAALGDLATNAGTVASSFGEMEFDNEELWNMAMASGASVDQLALLADHLNIATKAEIQASLEAFRLIEAFAKGETSVEQLGKAYDRAGDKLEDARQAQKDATLEMLNMGPAIGDVGMNLGDVGVQASAMGDAFAGAYAVAGIAAVDIQQPMLDLNQSVLDTTESALELGKVVDEDIPKVTPMDVHIENEAMLFERLFTIRDLLENYRRPIALTFTVGNIPKFPTGPTGGGPFPGIPTYATGTRSHPGGVAIVGEDGPEMVALPRGSRVFPNGTGPGAAAVTINVNGATDPGITADYIIRRLQDQGVIRGTPLR